MDQTILEARAHRLRGAAAMGGFVITIEQARCAVLASEKDARLGNNLTFEQARIEVRQINQSVLSRRS